MSRTVRSLVTLALLIVLVSGPAAALPRGARIPSAKSVLSSAWDWCSSLVAGLWEKAGSSMGSDGALAPNKEGGTMDPDDLNATGCPTEAGSIMDPNGKPIVCQPVA